MEYGTKILWRGCKESTSGWERQLIPPKRDKICFWYIIEFWKWNMMSRYSARYHQWGRGGKYKCVRPTASLSCSPSTAVLFLEKVEGKGKQEQKRTALYLFLYVFLVSLYLLSLIFFFPFLFFPSRTRPGWRQLGRQQSAPAQRSETLIHVFLLLF